MPGVTQDERGRRLFQIRKERAVENAVTKIRQSMGSGWDELSQTDIQTLNYILGEAWVSLERSVWEQSAFTRLTREDLENIIRIGNEAKTKKMREEAAIDEIGRILKRSI